ncbi:hypothetical protein AOQ84DRAFT_203285 [Glonium stellatum]|uniref:Uncharacterized protein n=1 Tax=Glonium stellatum TaxID=574774 RepID=A0A8E2F6V3_9PEZI|nr:hypothetical protein AOQ84DRAFT_203285 [Glonium stellatum]
MDSCSARYRQFRPLWHGWRCCQRCKSRPGRSRHAKRLTWTVSSESQVQTPLTSRNQPPRLFRIMDAASTLCLSLSVLATANHCA